MRRHDARRGPRPRAEARREGSREHSQRVEGEDGRAERRRAAQDEFVQRAGPAGVAGGASEASGPEERPGRGAERFPDRADQEQRGREVGGAAGVFRIAAREKPAVPGVAGDLPQVRSEKRSAVVRGDDLGIVDEARLFAVDEGPAEERVLARPVRRTVAADPAQERRPDEQVAARKVVLVAHRGGEVAPPRAARDERVFVDAAGKFRRRRIVARRHRGPADAADLRHPEPRQRVREPAGERAGVVVEKRHDFAARRPDAGVALLGGENAAGRDLADPRRPGFAGRGVRQDDRFEFRGGNRRALGGKRLDALPEHAARAGAGDHGRDGRRFLRHGVRLGGLVVAQEAGPPEDRGGVHEHVADVPRRERAGSAVVVQLDGSLGDAVAGVARDGENFEVEGVALRHHPRKREVERFAREEFHARLRVVDRQLQESVHEGIVDE